MSVTKQLFLWGGYYDQQITDDHFWKHTFNDNINFSVIKSVNHNSVKSYYLLKSAMHELSTPVGHIWSDSPCQHEKEAGFRNYTYPLSVRSFKLYFLRSGSIIIFGILICIYCLHFSVCLSFSKGVWVSSNVCVMKCVPLHVECNFMWVRKRSMTADH